MQKKFYGIIFINNNNIIIIDFIIVISLSPTLVTFFELALSSLRLKLSCSNYSNYLLLFYLNDILETQQFTALIRD